MARQRLTAANFLALIVVAALMAGCAAQYPPAPRPQPQPRPSPEEPDVVEPDVPSRPTADARAPTLALLQQSERSAEDGDLDSAIAYVERAIRLNSRDSSLWLRLARLQLQARRPEVAEQLAHKAIALADDGAAEERQAWLLVADALEAQGDDEGAAGIRARWRTYRG